MVGELTSVLGKEVVTLLKCIHHILERFDIYVSHLSQLLNVIGKLGFLDIHSLVGTPCGNHFDLKTTLASLLVIAKVVNGVVGGTYALYIIVAHQTTG